MATVAEHPNATLFRRGYEAFLTAIQDPSHAEHEETLAWAGGGFDPEAFDVQAVNRSLKAMR